METIPTKAKFELFVRGVTQTHIAAEAAVSIQYVNRCVNGQQAPSQKVRVAAVHILGHDPWEGGQCGK